MGFVQDIKQKRPLSYLRDMNKIDRNDAAYVKFLFHGIKVLVLVVIIG